MGKTVELMQKESNSPFQAFRSMYTTGCIRGKDREVKEVFIETVMWTMLFLKKTTQNYFALSLL